MKAIADTGFLVAFLNRRDRYHAWACELARQIDAPLPTAEAVLAETAFHVGSAEHALALVRQGMLIVDFDFSASLSRLDQLARRYADRSPDLADLCLICLSERYPKRPVLTVDGDFLIYRRHQRERIPVIMPEV
ncbi:MAG: type II toxin-antitoxin system VapC family toxin [Opitutales bacterium]